MFVASIGLLLLSEGCNQKATNNENSNQVQAIFPGVKKVLLKILPVMPGIQA
jgi:hypothetical protein